MRLRTSMCLALGLVVASTSLMACGDDDKKSNSSGGAALDHQVARQAIRNNTTSIADSISQSLGFLEHSSLFGEGFELMPTMGGDCDSPSRPGNDWDNNGWEDDGWGCGGSSSAEFSADLRPHSDEALDFLETHVFADANIESETSTSVTYLLRGSVFCSHNSPPQSPTPVEPNGEDPYFDDYDYDYDDNYGGASCEESVDSAQIRLRVSSPSAGNVNVKVLVGPDRFSPLDFEFHASRLSVELDLGQLKSTLEFLAELEADGPMFLPETMSGRVKLSVERNSENKFTSIAGITSNIRIVDNDFKLTVDSAPEALKLVADGGTQTLLFSQLINAIDAQFTDFGGDDDYYYDEPYGTGEPAEPRDPVSYGLKLGGLSSTSLFEAGQELLNITNIGLGNTSTTLSVNGHEALKIDLNANNGRTFDLSLQHTDAGIEATVSPAFDLRLALKFLQVQEQLGSVADWMLNEVITVNLSGAAAPKILTVDGGLKVLAGKLTMSSSPAGITLEADAGMCMMSTNTPLQPEEWEFEDSGDDSEYSEGESHPLASIEVTNCQ